MRALLVALCCVALAGCGEADVREQIGRLTARVDDLRERADTIRADAERLGDQVRERVREALDDLEKVVPEASLPAPTRQADTEVEAFLTRTLESIDRYWTRTLTAAGRDEPRVRYLWIPPGRRSLSGCGEAANDRAAFYCPADDTIYIGQRFARDLWEGVSRDFPGEASGQGRAVGDFGLAYVVAHEYAHNLQAELGIFRSGRQEPARPFELQADCFAGTWGNAVYQEGGISREDVREALSTAQAAGDFETGSAEHHGTPDERRDAWLLGWNTGDASECARFVTG